MCIRDRYRTGGLAHETGEPGIVYHMIGINGATSVTFSDDEKIKEIGCPRRTATSCALRRRAAPHRRSRPR